MLTANNHICLKDILRGFFLIFPKILQSLTPTALSVTLLCHYKAGWKMRLGNALCFLLRIFFVTDLTSFGFH